LDKEHESIQQSKTEFEKTYEIAKEIENEDVKNQANSLLNLMAKRYAAYEELYTAYSSSISLDKELYNMFQNKDLTLEQLESQIDKINKGYEQVISLNETFNKLTSDYNNQKKLFYENSGLEVVIEEGAPGK
jgi:predicted patatin/cPLA2 family phospholipase